jgi:hypothetical protein
MEGLILNLVSGAVGGNVVGRSIGSLNQGTIINSIAGIFGRWWECIIGDSELCTLKNGINHLKRR